MRKACTSRSIKLAVVTPNYEATKLCEDHRELLRQDNKANNIEKSLLKQLSTTLPNIYLIFSVTRI